MSKQPDPIQKSTFSLLEWVRSDLGKKALSNRLGNSLGSSSSQETIWLQVIGLRSDPDAGQLIGRLGDLGFQPGEPIALLGQAPFGEPLFIEIRETVLALRSEEASYIIIGELPRETR